MAKRTNQPVTQCEAQLLLDRTWEMDGIFFYDDAPDYKGEQEAENAWLRYAENAGWMETLAEERYDMLRGVIY